MAIAKMRKLHLVAMSYDKDAIFNALQRSGAVEVTFHSVSENTLPIEYNVEELKTRLATVQAALSALSFEVENYERERGVKSDILKDGFAVEYAEFTAAKEKTKETDALVCQINALTDKKNALKAELAKIAREKDLAETYKNLQIPFARFSDTVQVRVRLGLIPTRVFESAEVAIKGNPLCELHAIERGDEDTLTLVLSHKSVATETDEILSAFGFAESPYTGEDTGARLYEKLQENETRILAALQANAEGTYALKEKIRDLKIYYDALSFELEKVETNEKLRATKHTFFMQAYVPEDAEDKIREEIHGATQTVWIEFSNLTDEDVPPTLLKNNAVVQNFESITNAYSVPNYKEFDPNAVMAFFYSLFMGFIIGDVGYGILMLLGGGVLWWKGLKRPTGLSRLAGAFAIGGIFAIVWGALFNSLFGFTVFSKTVMPNPQTDMWSLAGISVPSVLIISMEIGIVQLLTGYICRAWQEWRRGNIVDGICDGVIWAIFSIGVGLAIVGFIDEANLPILATVGGIAAGVSLLLAIVTAGRKEKLLGKFTKGFGAAYGVINYASDILSYARLYGLMLSGAVIAQIIATYSAQFIVSGNIALILLGVVLLVVGNAFNLVMNLLGAYIHDARLQYVEFYGRFYEGDGELFKPLGSKHEYIYLLPAK